MSYALPVTIHVKALKEKSSYIIPD